MRKIGAEILESYDSELMQLAAVIARTHHERWDGSGYPAGLKQQEIPLCTRIVSVCDVFDALRSSRPYKDAWSIAKAVNYLFSESGKHFDPDVVAAFANIVDSVEALRQEHPDESSEQKQKLVAEHLKKSASQLRFQ